MDFRSVQLSHLVQLNTMTDPKTAAATGQEHGAAPARLRESDLAALAKLAKFVREHVGGGHPLSMRQTAALMGMSVSTVMRKTHAANPPDENGRIRVGMHRGADGKLRPGRRFDTTDRDAEIGGLHTAGRSMRAIASEVGCSVGTVHRVVSRLGTSTTES